MVADAANGWITASGLAGEAEIEVTLASDAQAPPREYTVRLFFSEVDGARPEEREFDVRLQGRTVLDDFDIALTAGQTSRTIVKEFTGVSVRDKLTVTLESNGTRLPPVLSGLEVRQSIARTPGG